MNLLIDIIINNQEQIDEINWDDEEFEVPDFQKEEKQEKQIDIPQLTELENQIQFLKNRITNELQPLKRKKEKKLVKLNSGRRTPAKIYEIEEVTKAIANVQSEISKLSIQLQYSEKKQQTMLRDFTLTQVEDQRNAYNNNAPQPTVILSLPTYHSNYRSLVPNNFFNSELNINFPIDNNTNNVNDNFDTVFLGKLSRTQRCDHRRTT